MGKTVAEDVIEEQQETKIQVEPAAGPSKQQKPQIGLIFGIINFVLILALAGGCYYLLDQVKIKQAAQGSEINKDDLREIEASKQLNAYQTQLSSMQSQIATFGKDIAGKDNHFTKTLADFSALHTEKLGVINKDLNHEITQLKRQLGKTRGDWLIADAEYLLTVANQRLHLMGDVHTTRMALEAADQRLRESGDGAAFKVREQIAKEISGLQTVALPDIVGIYSTVQILKDKVSGLAVMLPYAGKPLTESKQVHDHELTPEADHGLLNSALGLLEGYVTVKHSDQPVTTILTEEEVGFIHQQLNVKLEMIKISLVQQNDSLFKANIADAKQWLNKNFTKNTKTKYFQSALEKLNKINIRSEFPDISQSLKMLKDITKLRIETDKALNQIVDIPVKAENSAPAIDESMKAPEEVVVPAPITDPVPADKDVAAPVAP